MSISSLVNRIVPTATAFVTSGGNPAVAVATLAATDKALDQQKKIRLQNEETLKKQRELQQMAYFDQRGGGFVNTSMTPQPSTQNAGFGAGFGSFLRDVGSNILSPISDIFSQPVIRPFITQQSRMQPAIPTQSTSGGQESSESGAMNQAFLGGVPNILGQAAKFLRTPTGQVGLGAGGALLGGALTTPSNGIRITRKMKSSFRNILNMTGGDLARAADIMGVDQGFFVQVLLKRFRNDGPVVTKAALRKTKQTVRRLKSMCDMYDSLRPTATRRRTPMKRATSTTLIKN